MNKAEWKAALGLSILAGIGIAGCGGGGSAPSVPAIAPTVTAVAPASGGTGVAVTSTVTATFSTAMNASTITTSTFMLAAQGGTAVTGTVSYNPANETATFAPASSLSSDTTYTATITNGAQDSAGTALAASYAWSFTTAAGPAPAISAFTPGNGATSVSANTTVTASFSEAMNAATITASTFTLTAQGGTAVTGTVSYSSTDETATFTPNAALAYNSVYTATVTTGVVASDGTALAGNNSWSFTTSGPPPTVVSTTPLNNAAGVPVTAPNITATFSEAMNASTLTPVTFQVKGPNNTPVAGGVTYANSVATFSLGPGGALAFNTTYTATITTGAQNSLGTALAANYTWTFTTVPQPAPAVTSTTPANGAAGVSVSAPDIAVTFSEAIDPSTVTSSTFTLTGSGGEVAGTAASDASSGASFTPSANLAYSTTYTATITTGITGSAGTPLAQNYSWSFTTTTPPVPTVTATVPASGATNVSASSALTAAFSQPMNASTLTASTFTLATTSGGTPVTGTVTYNAGTATATFTPGAALAYSTGYTATITTGATSAAGAALASNYAWSFTTGSAITSIAVTPNTATIGTQQQFTATVNGTGSYSKSVTWSVAAPAGSSLSPGDISSTGLYNTPYPAPPTVTVTATSTQITSISGSVTVTLNPPATAAGPALAVDVNTPNTPSENPHTISPYVYGMNAYALDSASEKIANPGILRWGGDNTSRYNYQNGWSNSASDYYFENGQGAYAMFPSSTAGENFTQFFPAVNAAGSVALGTVPVNGWVSNGTNACSFPKSSYPSQIGQNGDAAFVSYNSEQCGYGVYPDGTSGCTDSQGCDIYGNNTVAEVTSISEPPPSITSAPAAGSASSAFATWADGTWSGGWVNSIVSNASYGNGASGKGVAVWDLDNEPTWWDAVHRDVHPDPFTYDEVTENGIGTALAIKTADPTALVSGPVIDYWWAYFYSKQDIEQGWSTGPCYEPWDDPTDREAHGGVPMIEYYLQQFSQYSQQYGIRLLDYVDIHGYFAPDYPAGSGNSVGLTTAGDTQEQEARMNGTRAFWDSTYTDPNYPQPNYKTDPNYTTSCSPPAQAPELVPMLQSWVSSEYPGTSTAIDEYNFGGLESINGAVVQADILGIFGRQGLGLGAFWPTTNYNEQNPGNYAFALYRNYDGNDSSFGNTYLYATSTSSGADAENQLAVYGAQRSSDGAITVLVINKTYGSLTSTISLENFTAPSGTTAQVYQYSNANLDAIVPETAVGVTPPSGSGTTSTIGNYTFPAQSLTLFVIPD